MAKTARQLIKSLLELQDLDTEVLVRTNVNGMWVSFPIHCVDIDRDVAIHFDNFNHLELKERR